MSQQPRRMPRGYLIKGEVHINDEQKDTLSREISGSPLFEPSNLDWEVYLSLGQKRHYSKGNVVFYANDCLDTVYYLKVGVIKQTLVSPFGTEKIVGLIKAGNLFGETIFFHGFPSQCTNIAIEDSLIYTFTRETVENMVNLNPGILMHFVRSMSLKMRMLTTQIDILCSLEAKLKVCKIIHLLAQNSNQIIQRMTHEEIAQLAGVHRVTVSNTLAQLRHINVLDYKQGHIVVKDPLTLSTLANGTWPNL